MARQPRGDISYGTFHVTAHAVHGYPLFLDDHDRRAFLWLLASVTDRLRLRCPAYCLMDTHYHLVLSAGQLEISLGMRLINGRYARRFNERHGRRGHVFAGRYSAYVIRDERHLEQTLQYIAENPVEAGLCLDAGDWPWTWIETDMPQGQA